MIPTMGSAAILDLAQMLPNESIPNVEYQEVGIILG